MKTLIYSFALLSFFFSIASCQKNDALQPVKTIIDSTKTVTSIPFGCDTTQLVKYVLYNSTAVDSYQIGFSGTESYTFAIPANGGMTVSVKPGQYAVQIYSTRGYSYNTFSLSYENSITGTNAKFPNVSIAPCTGPQFLTIASKAENVRSLNK